MLICWYCNTSVFWKTHSWSHPQFLTCSQLLTRPRSSDKSTAWCSNSLAHLQRNMPISFSTPTARAKCKRAENGGRILFHILPHSDTHRGTHHLKPCILMNVLCTWHVWIHQARSVTSQGCNKWSMSSYLIFVWVKWTTADNDILHCIESQMKTHRPEIPVMVQVYT